MQNTPNNQLVQVAGTEIQKIEYKGQPVVTFAMIDKLHGRVDRTARRAFNENRSRFEEEQDFFNLTSHEIRTMSQEGFLPLRTARAMIVTQRGYLKVVKILNDDRSWEVMDDMIDVYFAAKSPTVRDLTPQEANQARLMNKHLISLGKLGGLEGNQLLISANSATRLTTGVDFMDMMGMTHVKAIEQYHDLTPTQLGEKLGGLSAQAVNKLLCEEEYQNLERDHKRKIYYELTSKGKEAGGVLKDTGKKNSSGTPVKQVFWSSRIIPELQELLELV